MDYAVDHSSRAFLHTKLGVVFSVELVQQCFSCNRCDWCEKRNYSTDEQIGKDWGIRGDWIDSENNEKSWHVNANKMDE